MTYAGPSNPSASLGKWREVLPLHILGAHAAHRCHGWCCPQSHDDVSQVSPSWLLLILPIPSGSSTLFFPWPALSIAHPSVDFFLLFGGWVGVWTMFHRLDSSSLCSRGWPWTLVPLASSSPVLGSHVCAPVPGSSILHSFKLKTPPHPLELKSGLLSSISWNEYGHLEFSLSHLFNYLYHCEFMHSCSIV